MYKFILRPIFFLFDPEKVHHFVFKMIKLMNAIPGISGINRSIFCVNDKRLDRKLHSYVDYFVINVSCPNIGNIAKLNDKAFLIELLTKLKNINKELGKERPILLKIGPDRSNQQLDEVIEVVAASGIDGVIATNTATDRSSLTTSKEKLAEIGNGGLSGKPLKDRSTEVIRYLAQNSNKSFPIIGVGGIHSVEDALEKLEAGADLLQVYTGFIYEGPKLVKKINQAILSRSLK